jgi:hypothetical protein
MAPYLGALTPGTPPASGEIPSARDEQAKRTSDKVVAGQGAEAIQAPYIDASIKQTEDPLSHQVPFFNKFAMQPRPLRIITIGAGFSGLLIAHKLQHRFAEMQQYVSHSIYEQRSDIGGTWLVNTYPGVQCDVPSHIYVSMITRHLLSTLTAVGIPIRSESKLDHLLFQGLGDPRLLQKHHEEMAS